MSNKSIDSRIQGLEERLRTEHGHPRPRTRPGGSSQARRQLDLPSIPMATVSRVTQETEARLQEIIDMSGKLTINGVNYRSDISDLRHLGELGNGTCGHVVKMLHKPSNAVIAVKQMRRSGNSEENRRILMDLEVVLRSHDCPYIVRCLGYFITESDVWICMELMASCFDKILKRLSGRPIPEEILGKVTVATVRALSYLKEMHGVIHRDVKPSNILIDERGVVKLCDFGISGRLVDSKAKTRSAGCAAYMAPERIDPPDPQKPDYDIRADVWSLGITLFELATGNFPYSNCSNDFEVLAMVIAAEPPSLPENLVFSEDFRSFVRQCLTKDYLHRPKYAALLEHPFVEQATNSGASVANWLATALPSCSSRLVTTPPINCELNNMEIENSDLRTCASNTQINGLNKTVQSAIETEKSVFNCATSSNGLPTTNSPCNSVNTNSIVNKTISSTVSSPSSDATAISNILSNRLKGIEDYEDTIIRKLSIESDVKSGNYVSPNTSVTDSSSTSIEEKSMNDSIVSSETSTPAISDKVTNKSVQNHSKNMYKSSKESQLNSPLAYRTRSLSNASTPESNQKSDKWSSPKFFTSSPSPKNYFTNMETKNQPVSGGGPSSFDNYVNYGHCQDVQSGFRSYGSPEVSRRQYYSPSRNKFVYNYEYGTPRLESHTNVNSPNYSQRKEESYKNVPENSVPTACFRPNGPTNYFVSTSVCTMSKYPGSPSIRYCSDLSNVTNFHQNIGGSCSQPASLEAYGDMRHNPSGQPRMNEKSFSPPLWSPQFGCRWGGRDRDEKERELRSMGDSSHQQGNTSPIVLQRFFHQQGQRRSRRDWDANSRQPSSSLSRETSLGRSPEPPRRIHRDPSLPRDHLPLQYLEHQLRERELTPSRPILHDKNELMSISLDMENQSDGLKNRAHLYEKNIIDSSYSSVNNKRDNGHVCNERNIPFDSKLQKSTFHHHMREKEPKIKPNGDCQKVDREEKIDNDSGNFSNIHDQLLLERKNSKERSNILRDRDKKENVSNGDYKEEISRLSPLTSRRFGKSNGKEKDEQGGSRSSSPNRNLLMGGSAKVSRFTSHPQRITASDYDDVSKCSQDNSRNFTSEARNGGRAPKVPPRKTTASWSLPASPLPTRPV